MLRSVLCAALTGAVLALAAPATAATLPIVGDETRIEVTADLGGLGLAAAPVGAATVDVTGTNPVFTFPITGGSLDTATGNALIAHDGSGVELSALADPAITGSIGDFDIDTGSAQVFGAVFGTPAGASPLFDIVGLDSRGAELAISEFFAGKLTGVFGAPDLTGAQFGFAVPDVATVPVPAALPLMAGGLGLMAFVARRRG